jgi:hypothetical protein
VKPGGIYIIEDIINSEKNNVESFLDEAEYSAKLVFRLPVTSKWTNGTSLHGRVNEHDNTLAILIK